MLGPRHPNVLTTRYLWAQTLSSLGRYDEALKEIEAFAPLRAEVLGPRHPNVLTTRCLRADALSNLGRYDDAVNEIAAFAPVESEVLGARHPSVVATRSLRIGIDIAGRKNFDHEAELRSIIQLLKDRPISKRARYRLARLLFEFERLSEARDEISKVITDLNQTTTPKDSLLRSARVLLATIDGKPAEGPLIT